MDQFLAAVIPVIVAGVAVAVIVGILQVVWKNNPWTVLRSVADTLDAFEVRNHQERDASIEELQRSIDGSRVQNALDHDELQQTLAGLDKKLDKHRSTEHGQLESRIGRLEGRTERG